MVKTRIFQIAKELNISHTDILSFLKSKKVDVASHMSPVDETVHQMIMAEFSKDRETVERYRKEQVRKEIHDVKLKERQQTTKKLELLSLDDQRDLEKKESESQRKLIEKDKKLQEEQDKEKKDQQELRQQKTEELQRKQAEKEKNYKSDRSKKARDLKKKFKTTKKLRTINLDNIQTEIGKGTSKQPTAKQDNKTGVPAAPESIKMKVKGVLAQMDAKTKKKTYKKSKVDQQTEEIADTNIPVIQIAEFSSVEELAKIFEVTSSDIVQTCIELGMLVTKNQRLDWDIVELMADNFGFTAEKMTDVGEDLFSFEDTDEDIKNAEPRAQGKRSWNLF